jgi:hypothetical protein
MPTKAKTTIVQETTRAKLALPDRPSPVFSFLFAVPVYQ